MDYKYRASEEAKTIVADVREALLYTRNTYTQALALGVSNPAELERMIDSIDKFLRYMEETLNAMRAEGLDF